MKTGRRELGRIYAQNVQRRLGRVRVGYFYTENSVFYSIIAYLMCPVFTLIDFNVLTINNNNKIYLHDYNKVLQYCKSYLNLIINSL